MTFCVCPVVDFNESGSLAKIVILAFWLECSWAVVLTWLLENFGGSFSSRISISMVAESELTPLLSGGEGGVLWGSIC